MIWIEHFFRNSPGYESDVLKNTFINPGFASFNLDRLEMHKPAKRIVGFSSDLFDPTKLFAIKEKISEKVLFDPVEIFKEAQKVYEKNKIHIPKET